MHPLRWIETIPASQWKPSYRSCDTRLEMRATELPRSNKFGSKLLA